MLGLRRDERTSRRWEHLLLAGAVLALLLHQLPVVRSGGDAAAVASVERAAERRLGEDAHLHRELVTRIGPALPPADSAAAFDLLATAFRQLALTGRGVKLYSPDAALVAWFGETFEPGGSSRVVRLGRGRAAVDMVLDRSGAGVVVAGSVREWRVVLEDPWLRGSPVEALALPRSGWMAELGRRAGVRVALGESPAGVATPRSPQIHPADAAGSGRVAPGGAALRIAGRELGRVQVVRAGGGGEGGAVPLRLAALLLIATWTLLIASTWRAVERAGRRHSAASSGALLRGWALPLVLKGALLLAFRLVFTVDDLLQLVVPGPLSSPLAFGSPLLGPLTASPADVLLTALMLAMLALDAFRTAPAGWSPEPSAMRGASPRAPRALLPLIVVAVLFIAGVLGRVPLVRAATALVRDTSTELLLRPNLYSTAEGAVLFAALASLAAAALLSVAAVVRLAGAAGVSLAGAAVGEGRDDALPGWRWALAAALLLALACVLYFAREGAAVSASTLVLGLWAMLLAGALGLAGWTASPRLAGREWTRCILAPAIVVGLLSGVTAVTTYGAGRLWGVRQAMADRLEEVAVPTNQWVEYNLRLAGERLAEATDRLAAFGVTGERAAFLAWTETPLRDLPLPSAVVVSDEGGVVRSRFSLLPAEDLQFLPRIAVAAMRAPAGRVGRAQTEAGRQLFFVRIPLR
ncbi:MAG: hypothetical protein ABR599_10610, partial [Gemmatimonadota bacterium]